MKRTITFIMLLFAGLTAARAQQSTDATLSKLAISTGTFSPAFSPTTYNYTVIVGSNVFSEYLRITANDAGATIRVTADGQTTIVPSGGLTPQLGTGLITIKVLAADGVTQKNYTVTIYRPISTDASLKSLTIGAGSLSPAFSPTTYNYTVAEPNSVSSVKITAVANASTAYLEVRGGDLGEDGTSVMILTPGTPAVCTIVGHAEDLRTTLTYTVTIIRATAPTDADLDFDIGYHLSITPALSPAVTSYTVTEPNTENQFFFEAIPVNERATVAVNGAVTGYEEQNDIDIAVGSNIVTVFSTAGPISKTYTFNVIRAASPVATLSALTLSAGTWSPVFATGTTSYTVAETNSTTSITVKPTTTSTVATVTVNGTAVTSGTSSASIPLSVGPNTISVVVTAQDGTTQTYTITATRNASGSELSALSLSSGTLSPAFAPGTPSYQVSVHGSVASVTLTPTVNSAGATVTVNGTAVTSGSPSGPIPVSTGPNPITIVVTAADGTTQQTYTVTVNKLSSNADLIGIDLDYYPLSPAFDRAITSYTVGPVPNYVAEIILTATVAYPSASLTINGTAASSGREVLVPLSVGSNVITLGVTAQDGTTKTYTLSITRMSPGQISSNADLASIDLNYLPIFPAFDPAITSYTVGPVPNFTTEAFVAPHVADPSATLTVNGTVTATGTEVTVPLSVGSNVITLGVTAQDGTTKTYTLSVTRASPDQISSNADLAGIDLNYLPLYPAFDPAITSYTVGPEPNYMTDVFVTPHVADISATLTVNGTVTSTGMHLTIPISVGSNVITFVVTAQDGTTKTYTLSIIKVPPGITSLSSLLISHGSLSPEFSPSTGSYTTSEVNEVSYVTVRPTATSVDETITVNGIPVASGALSQQIPLAQNAHTYILIATTAADGVNTGGYGINVTRLESTVDSLSYLSLNHGTLSPAFDPATYTYTAAENYSTTSITVKPTATSPRIKGVLVNGVQITSGTPSGNIPLAVGANNITVIVYAESPVSQTYHINVIRAADPHLSALGISSGTLSPAFAKAKSNYTAVVDGATASLTFTPTTEDAAATVSVNGTAVTSGTPSGSIPLALGPNNIPVVVTAHDGTTQTYTVTVVRGANALLSGLKISNGNLSPGFVAGTNSYTVTEPYGVSFVSIRPTTGDPAATVKVNGTAVTSGTISGNVPLTVGINTISVVVTAADGTTTQTYTITVTRTGSAVVGLHGLDISAGILSPAFATGTTDYTVTESDGVTSITVRPTTASLLATVTVNGAPVASGRPSASIPLSAGPNVITLIVTGQDGVTTQTYTITVIGKGTSSNADLSALSIGNGTLSPVFDPATTGYTAAEPITVAFVVVKPVAADGQATITVNGIAVPSGMKSDTISLTPGANAIAVVVTASDQVTTKTYTIAVSRALSTDAYLSNLTLSPTGVTSFFLPTTLNYEAERGSTTYVITPTTHSKYATVTVGGIAVPSGTGVTLTYHDSNDHNVDIVVTAEDGVTKMTYNIDGLGVPPPPDDAFPSDAGVTKPTETATLAEDGIAVHPGLSPNGDGINDFFQIDNISQYPDNKVTITNRNGQLIYEAKGYDNSSKVFDGHNNKTGQLQLPGTYFYQLDYTVNGVAKHKTGFLVLKY